MSYRFRLVLANFAICGATKSYSSRSCRTEFLVEPTDTTDWRRQMGTIIGRSRKDGSKAFTAQIVIKKDGAIVYREAHPTATKSLRRTTRRFELISATLDVAEPTPTDRIFQPVVAPEQFAARREGR
jgi:hypothetical protein